MSNDTKSSNGGNGSNGVEKTFSVNLSGAILSTLISIQQEDERGRSLQYWAEETLVTGCKAIRRSREYAEETRNRKEFARQVELHPEVLGNLASMQALMRKYRIGGAERVEMKSPEVAAGPPVASLNNFKAS